MNGYKFIKRSATTSGVAIGYSFESIKFITNDSDTSIYISLCINSSKIVYGDEIELKAGETINDIDGRIYNVKIRCDASESPFRLMGVL